jgi:hypothetical protein
MSSIPATPTGIQLAVNKPAWKHSDDERAETVSEQRQDIKNVSSHTPEVSRSGGKSPTITISEQTVELQTDDKQLRASIGKVAERVESAPTAIVSTRFTSRPLATQQQLAAY